MTAVPAPASGTAARPRTLRTLADIDAAAERDTLAEPVRTQEWADRVALILAGSRHLAAQREPQAA